MRQPQIIWFVADGADFLALGICVMIYTLGIEFDIASSEGVRLRYIKL